MVYIFSRNGGVEPNISLLKGIVWNFNDEVLWFVRTIIILYLLFAAYVWGRQTLIRHRYKVILSRVLLISLIPLSMWVIGSGFVHGMSIGLFFLGVFLAEAEKMKFWNLFVNVIVLIAASVFSTFIINYKVGIRLADWAHLMFNVIFFLTAILVCSKVEINIPKLPKWLASCSYDVYLVHNKAFIILSHSYIIIPLWGFVGMTALFTILFYNLRKLVHI